MALQSVNPATGKVLKSYPEMTRAEVNGIIDKTHADFLVWRRLTFKARSERFRRVAELLRMNSGYFAKMMAREMGKPITQGKAEAEKCAWVCDYYAENAQKHLRDQKVTIEGSKSFVTFQPLGVILGIMPWNFPFWQVLRAAAPAMMAGNGMVLKHASNVPECALSIEALFHEAGFPAHIFRTLMIGPKTACAIIGNDKIKAISLTGSVEAGRAVASEAARHLKKTVLELGGSDPYLILEDADLDMAASLCIEGRMFNGGQTCISAKRLIVVEGVKERFEQLIVKEMKKYKTGDPMKSATRLGPLANTYQRDALHEQVNKSIKAGAKLLLGGEMPKGSGAFYPSTVLTDVKKGMPAADEELFGPVAVVLSVKDEQEAVAVANDSPFGLGAGVFTSDRKRGERIVREELEAGTCYVNDFVKSDPRMPFGGVKQSGWGRELGSYGIREFVNIKSVRIQ